MAAQGASAHPNLFGVVRKNIHYFELRVYYEDTDFSGVVYHANYLRYAERARSDYLSLCDIRHQALWARQPPLAFVVTHMTMRFWEGAVIDDILEVRTAFRQLGGAHIRLEQVIYLAQKRLWESACVVVCIVPKQSKTRAKLVRLPKDIANKIKQHVTDVDI